jgi:hypothetical protein
MHATVRLLLSLFIAGVALVGTSGSASAEDNFQYWGYYQVKDGSFTYATKGAGATNPAEGSIEGHRWSATPQGKMNVPRADLTKVTFDAVCGDSEAADGEKRIAVIVDFGVEADALGDDETPAPFAECAVVPEAATGLQALQAVAEVRTENSSFGPSLCGIDGYPSTSCADESTATASPADEIVDVAIRGEGDESSSDDDDDSNLPLLIGAGVVVVLLGAGGVALSRRNKTAA